MQRQKKTIFLLLIVLLMAATAIAAFRSQDQPGLASGQGRVEGEPPVTDFYRSEPSDAGSRARREARGRRYDKQRLEKVEELPEGIIPLPIINHWWVGLPALPTAQSDAIVRGTVTDGQAYLSTDKTGIYSEFTIHIDELLKCSNHCSLSVGNAVVADRPGGAVRFPSGKVQRYSISEQGVPRVGGSYVFFLKSCNGDQDFTIITAYEFRGGNIFPLDRSSNRTELPFDIYNGSDEGTFLNALRNAIANPSSPIQGGQNQ